jgi:hypothetical protein
MQRRSNGERGQPQNKSSKKNWRDERNLDFGRSRVQDGGDKQHGEYDQQSSDIKIKGVVKK